MNGKLLDSKLAAGEIVPLKSRDWKRLAARFVVIARHDTHVAGDLLIVRGPVGLAVVEFPGRGGAVIRPLADEKTARSFVTHRLEAYDRFWDG